MYNVDICFSRSSLTALLKHLHNDRAATNKKMKETVAIELSYLNSNLQLLKEQLAELNSSMELYQMKAKEEVLMPMIPLGLKETKEIDMKVGYICTICTLNFD